MDVYRSAVLQAEQRLQQPPAPPLLSLQRFFSEFEILLPEVLTITKQVQQGTLSAAQLMSLLDKRTRCGIPLVQSCAGRLLWHLHQVMFKQLEAWLVHGELIDAHQDFFIQHAGGKDGTSMANINASNGGDLDGFQVVEAALPPGVSAQTASMALFIGKAVRIMRQAGAAAGGDGVQRSGFEVVQSAQFLWAVQRQEVLRPAALQNAIAAMQSTVAAALWDLLQRRCDLSGYLTGVESYLLLGRGDLYQQLLQDTAVLMAGPPSPASANVDAMQAFTGAAMQSGAESDPFLCDFVLRWLPAEPGAEFPPWHPATAPALHVPGYDGWDGLCLECVAKWPLQLLFPPELLRQYSALWQLMFRLKRVQLDLEAAWALLSSLERPQKGHGRRQAVSRQALVQFSQLRQRMAHFVTSLQTYLRVDVIQPGVAALHTRIAGAKDFTDASSAHSKIVETMVEGACLDVKQLMGAIEAIFGMCKRLCALARELENRAVDAATAEVRVMELSGAFRLKHNLVFQLLQSSKLQSGPRASTLRQLVLRLNFNEFCGREALQEVQRAVQNTG